jgi:multiple sugar transport system substrate-binding protein
MRVRAVILAAALMLAPLAAWAADLVVWWEKGFNPEEVMAIQEIATAFEQKTGKQVELDLYPFDELPDKVTEALQAGKTPDLAFGRWLNLRAPQWAFEGRLAELTATMAPFRSLFDADSLDRWTMTNARTGGRALYGLPTGRIGNYAHVWKSLLEQAGFTLADIPKEWEGFWSFWCDQVQPAVRKVLGRDDVWGVGRVMSAEAADTEDQLFQLIQAYEANYITREGQLLTGNPEVRRRLGDTIRSYTETWRKGCTPPDAVDWDDAGNNKAFLAQRVVMTPNVTLSIPNALKHDRPDDYYKNSATIEWPRGPGGGHFPIASGVFGTIVFADAGHGDTARDFIRFLIEGGWLGHYLNFADEWMLPTLVGLLGQPFWLDPRDPHKLAAVIQAQSRTLAGDYARINPRFGRIYTERVWAKSVRRVAIEGVSPEQAVNEAIARIKQILSE